MVALEHGLLSASSLTAENLADGKEKHITWGMSCKSVEILGCSPRDFVGDPAGGHRSVRLSGAPAAWLCATNRRLHLRVAQRSLAGFTFHLSVDLEL